ncbi:MAG: hypothetical protein BWY82_02918 [Verrucomicrobia bacterium ADurb.Bin474]|nr:MAG: hypothetical protein BWY82_02918 [Verrucomicrobia bacterium ADurb.Bin474]
MIAEIVVRTISPGLAHQQTGGVKCIVVGGQNLVLGGDSRHPVREAFLFSFPWVGVPFAPEPKQSKFDESNAGIPVVARSERSDEVEHRSFQIGMFVVGRYAGGVGSVFVVGVVPDGNVTEKRWNAGGVVGTIVIELDERLMPSA